ncbi:MAG: DUF3524 domain-containing protein, partial [Cyanobacteria bacterium J06649_11]
WGYAEGFADYAGLVKSAHILPVTSRQDFFGGSVVEAMYCGVYPLLPDRLAFGEHVVVDLRQDHVYTDQGDLINRLRYLLELPASSRTLPVAINQHTSRYDWQVRAVDYDQVFREL